MSKVAVCTDIHFGVRRGNELFLRSQMDFFKKQFIPYLHEHNIKDVLILGDVMDNRQHINLRIKNEVFDLFDNEFKPFNVHMLVGNHDSYYRSSIDVHALKMFKSFDNINVIDDIQMINIDGRDILMVPWIVDQEDFVKRVENKNTDCEVCMGHFETKGFKLNSKAVSNIGIKSDVFFRNFKLVFSGHFHTRSKTTQGDSIIQYIGNIQHLTRHDIGDERGFCILDTDTLEYEFVENTVSMKFVKIQYPKQVQRETIENNFVDIEVIYDENYNEEDVQEYLRKIESYNPAVPPFLQIDKNFKGSDKDDYRVQTVQEIIKEYVESLQIENKEAIFNKIENLYNDSRIDI